MCVYVCVRLCLAVPLCLGELAGDPQFMAFGDCSGEIQPKWTCLRSAANIPAVNDHLRTG